MDKAHWIIRVKGRVQGVAYRAYARDKANQLGLNGYARNMPGGSVMLEVEGPVARLSAFYNWCKKGPMWARVDHIDLSKGTVRNMQGFIIR